MHLRRPSDHATSEPRSFRYLPSESGSVGTLMTPFNGNAFLARKKANPDFDLYSHILAMDAAVLARQFLRSANGTAEHHSDVAVQCNLDKNREEGSQLSETQAVIDCAKPQKTPVEPVKSAIIEHPVVTPSNGEKPPPVPEKGTNFAQLKSNLMKKSDGPGLKNPCAKNQKNPPKSVNFNDPAVAVVISDSESEARFSVASSEDLNSRLSAAFSDYSDLTDVHSLAGESEVDINDALSLISSTHTLNDRLSLVSDVSDLSDTDQTIISAPRSETGSVDTLDKHLEMLESMSVEPDSATYSSFQMAMKHPIIGWPGFQAGDLKPTEEHQEAEETLINDLVYDDPEPADDLFLKPENLLPAVPPRVESMAVPTPPLPPRRFKKINAPLPDPPTKDHGLKSALQVLKQTFKKSKPPNKADTNGEQASLYSSQKSINTSQENISEVARSAGEVQSDEEPKKTSATEEEISEAKPDNQADQAVPAGLDPSDCLTEAENYALYMRLAPLATASEFDENETMSMLYGELRSGREPAKETGIN